MLEEGYERCLICNTVVVEQAGFNNSATVEHIFPQSIGGSATIYPVCKSCNDRLGRHIDNPLVEHVLVLAHRQKFKLVGKKGHVPNPLRGAVLTNDEGRRVIQQKNGDFKVVPLSEFNGHKLEVNADAHDSEEFLRLVRKQMSKLGYDLSDEEIWKRTNSEFRRSVVSTDLRMDNSRYWRCLVKIAYELAVDWLGTRYLADPMSVNYRDVLLDHKMEASWSDKYKVVGHIGYPLEIAHHPWHLFNLPRDNHIAIMIRQGSDIACAIRIFDVFEAIFLISSQAA